MMLARSNSGNGVSKMYVTPQSKLLQPFFLFYPIITSFFEPNTHENSHKSIVTKLTTTKLDQRRSPHLITRFPNPQAHNLS